MNHTLLLLALFSLLAYKKGGGSSSGKDAITYEVTLVNATTWGGIYLDETGVYVTVDNLPSGPNFGEYYIELTAFFDFCASHVVRRQVWRQNHSKNTEIYSPSDSNFRIVEKIHSRSVRSL